MHGWRARIALLIAHSNTIMEPEFNAVAPQGVSVHATRFKIGTISVEGNLIENERLHAAVDLLSDLNARVFAFPCTAANMAAGPDADIEQAKMISGWTGKPTVPASSALLEALVALDAKRIAIATPYPPDLNHSTHAFWQHTGIEVMGISGVDLGGSRRPHEPLSSSPVSHVGLQPPEVVYNLARKAYTKGVDAVVISGAGLRTIEIAEQFEQDFGLPLISSSLATMWASLQAAGIREPIKGFGRLLSQQPQLRWHRIPRV